MIKFDFKSMIATMAIAVVSLVGVGCSEPKSENTDSSLVNSEVANFNGIFPHPIESSGWGCMQLIKGEEEGENARTIGFYNFFVEGDKFKYVAISRIKMDLNDEVKDFKLIYTSSGEYRYNHEEFSFSNVTKDLLLTDKTVNTLRNYLSDSEIASLKSNFGLLTSNSDETTVLKVTEEHRGKFKASNDDLSIYCKVENDIGIFFEDTIDENHPLVKKLEQ